MSFDQDELDTFMLEAARDNARVATMAYIGKGANPLAVDADGWTAALRFAAVRDADTVVRIALVNIATMRQSVTASKLTPCHLLAMYGELDGLVQIAELDPTLLELPGLLSFVLASNQREYLLRLVQLNPKVLHLEMAPGEALYQTMALWNIYRFYEQMAAYITPDMLRKKDQYQREPILWFAYNLNVEAVLALAKLAPDTLESADGYGDTAAILLAKSGTKVDDVLALATLNAAVLTQDVITAMLPLMSYNQSSPQMGALAIARLIDAGFLVPDDLAEQLATHCQFSLNDIQQALSALRMQ